MAKPFQINLDHEVIDNLCSRLKQTKSFERQHCDSWKQGCESQHLAELIKYWSEEYDFEAQFAKLNELNHFHQHIQAPAPVSEPLKLHYIHHESQTPDAIPLLLVHGWPGSFVEFVDLIPELIKPKNGKAFHVVVPSLPGYGFSQAPSNEGLNIELMADMLNDLMLELGYKQYVLQGGDWGGILARCMGVRHPTTCVGLHVNFCVANRPKPNSLRNAWTLTRFVAASVVRSFTRSDGARLKAIWKFFKEGTGYQMIQGTKPETLGVALSDSPAGLAAWLLEKFQAWGDTRERDVFEVFSKDVLCTNLTLYWMTNTITSSMRLYYESLGIAAGKNLHLASDYCSVPTGVSDFPTEIIRPPKVLAQLTFNLQDWQEHPQGGHFAALEQPKELEADVRHFFFAKTNFADLCKQASNKEDRPYPRPYDWVDYAWVAIVVAVLLAIVL